MESAKENAPSSLPLKESEKPKSYEQLSSICSRLQIIISELSTLRKTNPDYSRVWQVTSFQLHATYQMLESLKTPLKLHTVMSLSDKIARISARTSDQTTQTPSSTRFGF